MTPELAAENAAKILDQANEHPFDAHEAAALVSIADGWTRLHTALAHAPKIVEPVTVNIEGLAGKDVDPKQIAEYVALAAGWPRVKPLTEPRSYLQGDENGDVSLHCRDCFDGGRPLVFYNPHGDEYPDPKVESVATISALLNASANHEATVHQT